MKKKKDLGDLISQTFKVNFYVGWQICLFRGYFALPVHIEINLVSSYYKDMQL